MARKEIQLLYQAAVALVLLAVAFVIVEPSISKGATTASSQFTIAETISGELAFLSPPSNVSLSPSLGGLTGGTSNGGTQFIIRSSNALGYTVSLTASSSAGMVGNANGGVIPTLANSLTPSLNFTAPANSAAFGYTVEASTTADLAPLFKDNGSTCNTGSGDTANACWLNASTTAVTIINRSTPTDGFGATTTIKFRVIINANPSPAIVDDTYVATTTLTATSN